MGSAIIDVQKGIKEGYVLLNTTDNPTPKWIPLKYSKKRFKLFNNISLLR